MKFVIENISKSGRIGHLVQADTGKQFKTPLLLQTTKSGSVPFISRDAFNYVSKDVHVLQMSLATMDHMAESLTLFKEGLSSYVGFKGYPTFLTIRDPCEVMPNGHNDRDTVPLFTKRGKEPLSVNRFMDLVEAFEPDLYQGLSDADTNIDSAKKRVQKSVDRTNQFMEACYERHSTAEKLRKCTLFAPIVGGYNTFARSQSIKHALAKGEGRVGGYLFEGFHNYGLSATAVCSEKLLQVMEHCLPQLEVDKPKMSTGAYTPLLTLELIRLGVDMFDTSYAYCAAVNFKALSFRFRLATERTNTTNTTGSEVDTPFIDLTDESLKEDFTAILKDCSCLACRKHTRAYIHHLYKTKELLGPILLMIHNLHHYMEFFEVIRACIQADTLPDLLQLVKYQGTDKEADYQIYANTKVIDRVGLGKGFISAAN